MKQTTIRHDDLKAAEKQHICFYCKHFFCTNYYMELCDGGLPQWKLLTALMRNVKANDTCKNFELHKAFQQRTK